MPTALNVPSVKPEDQWPGATHPRICPDCGKEYLVTDLETVSSDDDVCKPCWDAFDGETIEGLLQSLQGAV